MMTEFERLARALTDGHVDFIVIGGWAGILQGLAHTTYDVDVVYGRNYQELLPHSRELELNGIRFRCVTLERLIQLKRAAGRPKDLDKLAALVALLEETRNSRPPQT